MYKNTNLYYDVLYFSARLDNRLAKTGMPSSTDVPAVAQNGIPPAESDKSQTNPYLVEIVGKSIPSNGKQFQTTSALKIEVRKLYYSHFKVNIFGNTVIVLSSTKVTNSSTTTSFGPLSNLKAVNAARTTVWEIFIGSAINRFCVSTKYVLTCSADGTVRILDILSGTLLMPIVKLPCISVQCCFVNIYLY